MIVNFKEAVIARLHHLYTIDQKGQLTAEEMEEYFFLLQNYVHFLKESEKNEQ